VFKSAPSNLAAACGFAFCCDIASALALCSSIAPREPGRAGFIGVPGEPAQAPQPYPIKSADLSHGGRRLFSLNRSGGGGRPHRELTRAWNQAAQKAAKAGAQFEIILRPDRHSAHAKVSFARNGLHISFAEAHDG
jgi:Asp-tRNA(Asn)/Glu-tRNA(Gln) amidotransferase A subunit family amidase